MQGSGAERTHIKTVDSRLHSLGILQPLDFNTTSPSLLFPQGVNPLELSFGGPSYIDDNSTLLMHSDPKQLLKNVIDVIQSIIDTSIKHGLAPNLKEGKYEMFIKFCGKSAKEVDLEVFTSAKPASVRFLNLCIASPLKGPGLQPSQGSQSQKNKELKVCKKL